MANNNQQKTNEYYSINNQEVQQEYVRSRRAAEWVPFFLPHLKPGMRLLDCGCGVGSITMDLAEIVAPGQVIGLDTDQRQLAAGRALAAQRGLANIEFWSGNVYHLPFADTSFDAVLAHTLLYHLSEPLRALREMRRVLKSGGVAAVSDDDLSTLVVSPEWPSLLRCTDLWRRFIEHNGGSPFYSRHLRGLLLRAGFASSEGHIVARDYYGTVEQTTQMSWMLKQLMGSPVFRETAVNENWVDAKELDTILTDLETWGRQPDAFLAITYCAALGWVK